jgi:hypothetical protein
MGQDRRKISQWDKYLPKIKKLVRENGDRGTTSIARQIAKEENLHLNKREIDLFRTYISRYRKKLKLKPLQRHNSSDIEVHEENNNCWDERSDSAVWSYDGTHSVTSLQEAIEFSRVDTDIWEVERHVFNSWDVTMKVDGTPTKRTNYQVKVWFRRIEKLDIKRPEPRIIVVTPQTNVQMWVTIGCIHRPFHDKILWDRFISFLKHNRKDITGIIIDGDYLDLRSLSSHEDWLPEGVDLSMEYSDGLQGIQEIEDNLKTGIDKIFIYGNHEDRFFRDKNSIRKYGNSLPAPHEALELEERGWEIITDWKNGYVTIGNELDVFHGTKVGMNASKDQLHAIPNRDHVFFHTHRFGSYSNKTNTAYNLGCMIDFDHDAFKYVDRGVRGSWAHGFGVIYVDPKNDTHVYPIKVTDDRHFFFKGIVY